MSPRHVSFLGRKIRSMDFFDRKKKKEKKKKEELEELIRARKASTNKELTEKARKYILRKSGLLPDDE